MELNETERDIKKELRASMNGILSARMRQAGMPYKIIFGTELPRLRDIASEFPVSVPLAMRLWQQPIRETRLLAIMLMPAHGFTPDVAEAWGSTLLSAEEAQVLAMQLMPGMPGAKDTALRWIGSNEVLRAVAGALCLRHLLVRGWSPAADEHEMLLAEANRHVGTANLHLKKAIQALSAALIAKKES